MSQHETTSLGKTDIHITPLGIGAWAWGDRFFWLYGHGYNDADIRAAFETSVEAGINFYDTAEVYGSGHSERLLGSFLPSSSDPVVVASKFMPFPWRLSKKALPKALHASLKRLGLERVDLYQIHWPFPPVAIETWADALADMLNQGLTRAVGVSNYDESQMRRAYSTLAKRGVPLASIQVPYNLLDRKVELNGLLKTCNDLGVTLIAYSPLAQGVLTGKYSPSRPLPGVRGRRYNRALLERVQPLLRLLRDIGQEHGGKTPAQVALNWCICKGTVPIPGTKNARQAQENIGGVGWRMTEAEVAVIDEASLRLA